MSRAQVQPEVSGLAVRRVAADIVEGVLRGKRALDDHFDGAQAHPAFSALEDRDRALVRMLAATVLRRLGSLRFLLARYLAQGLPKDAPRVETALLIGAAQILWLDVPDHAAVDLAVRLVQADRRAQRYPGLVNAVLRRVTREGAADLAAEPATLDLPPWLAERWVKHHGESATEAIALAQRAPPPLDVTIKQDAESWAHRLRGHVLATGSVRLVAEGAITRMPGFDEGAWWVQDAAAALPARLLGDVAGQSVADLCAAPGGKSAQLAAAGARVTAVDRSAPRMTRLTANFARLGLTCETVIADITTWEAPQFDAVLLDAPCLATGTIRRHPDVAWLKREGDIAGLADLQRRLLDAAVAMTKPGGRVVYSVCSLEPEEGEQQIADLLARNPSARLDAIQSKEVGGLAEIIDAGGQLRSLPSHLPHADPQLAGLDGFFAARLLVAS